jgi:alginate O-acetyltransferase complex protein AlgI
VEIKTEYFDGMPRFFYHPKLWVRQLSYMAIVILILLIGVFDGGQFIYFQF